MQADAQHCQDILSILTQLSQSVSQSGPFVHSLACLSSSWLTATIRFARQQQNATRRFLLSNCFCSSSSTAQRMARKMKRSREFTSLPNINTWLKRLLTDSITKVSFLGRIHYQSRSNKKCLLSTTSVHMVSNPKIGIPGIGINCQYKPCNRNLNPYDYYGPQSTICSN